MSTNISWCVNSDGSKGEVWNPVVGCTHSGSPGCDNCYAEALHNKRHKAYSEGKLQNLPQYAKPFDQVQCIESRLDAPLHWRKPRTVFVNSVSDLFHEQVPFEFVERVMLCIEQEASQHTYIILTKRSKRMAEFFEWYERRCSDSSVGLQWTLPDNIYLGLSASTQADLDAKIGDFLQVPGRKILSLEPLLGEIDAHLMRNPDMWLHEMAPTGHFPGWRVAGGHSRISGVIVGGESGKNARPMHPDWVRSLKDQCAAAEVPFYFKQWGEFVPRGRLRDSEPLPVDNARTLIFNIHGNRRGQAAGSLTNHVCEFSDDSPCEVMERVGVKAAGRLLDGVIHTALPWREEVPH